MNKIVRYSIIILIILLSINISFATPLVSDAEVSMFSPENNYGGYYYNPISGGRYLFIEVAPENSIIHLYCDTTCAQILYIYDTSIFNEMSITWDTQPAIENEIINKTGSIGWNDFDISNRTSDYIVIISPDGTTEDWYSRENPSYTPYTDGTLETTTPTPTPTPTPIPTTTPTPIGNLISYMGNPYQEGNFIKGVYSNNYNLFSLWNYPKFVWGISNYSVDNKSYVKACIFDSEKIFMCDFVPNTNYSFQFEFSDIQNYNNSTNFFSNKLYINKDNAISKSRLSNQANRETTLKNFFFDLSFFLFFVIIVIMIFSYNRDDLDD
jgi:hypothetical protein